ncbi:DUF4921 family protein, partial [Candidatus Jorgensenbacteria bacterium]|nr:DUF4921 family protein [Candidatus Jorgensenbacteria bacterium]
MIYSEFRKDIVSGDWILIASGRLKRPHAAIKRRRRKTTPISKCPFERPLENVHEKILLSYEVPRRELNLIKQPGWKNWEILVLQNKYPVVRHSAIEGKPRQRGLYTFVPGFGHHDLLITRNHHANFAELSPEKAFHVFEAFRDRYLMLLTDPDLSYISMFHNWGPLSGATVYHPHYQLIGLPVVPPDIEHSLNGSRSFFKKNGRCVHCVMIETEKKVKKRMVAENTQAIAFAPFVSRDPFEIRVFPKKHLPYFENTFDEDLRSVANVLQKVLRQMKKNLNDPDYNFFIHTSP